MADLSWTPMTAFGRREPLAATIGAVRIAERVDVALGSLAIRRGREGDVARIAADAGIPLPDPARWAGGDPWGAFWVAPEMWLVEAPFATHEAIEDILRGLFGDAASVTEQTDAWVRLDLAAPDLPPLLERLCNVDWPTRPDGYATRTVIEHLGCYLIRTGPGAARLYGPRSSAASLLHAIEVAAHSLMA